MSELARPAPAVGESIQEWIRGLAEIPAAEFEQERVQRYILDHAILPASLEPYVFFSSQGYTRNLIFKNEVFECLVLCWEIGQASPVHNHNDRLGWIYLAAGRLFVQSYRLAQRNTARRTCRLVPAEAAELGAGQPAYVDREQAVHEVYNLNRFNQRTISVHVYQQPMTHCEVYSLETGTYDTVPLTYTSELGRLNPGIKL